MKTDLLIIGSGPGGYRAAGYAARNGLSVVVAERDQAGGTCLNAGCIPTKCLAHDASAAPSDFASAMERKALVTQQLRTGVEQLLSAPGITLVRGQAAFTDAHTVTIGDTTVEADNIIIATGSESRMPSITGIDNPRVITSTEALQLQSLPETMVIVGAGVIGMEFASILARFGSKVTVIEYLKECLPMFDKDIAKRLRKAIEKQGVTFFMDSAVSEITDEEVIFKSNKTGAETRLPCAGAPVLIATGRKPSVEGLNLEAAVVDYDAKGIKTDDCLRTSQPHIYAIGDVNGRCMLAHAATMQGFRAVNHILGITDGIRFDVMPSAVFTTPEAASVGVSEDYCKEHSISYECRKAFHRANGKALAMNETEGLLKLIVESGTKRIIGCHAFGAHAADLVQEASVLICKDTTLPELHDMIHIHPTLSEILYSAAE